MTSHYRTRSFALVALVVAALTLTFGCQHPARTVVVQQPAQPPTVIYQRQAPAGYNQQAPTGYTTTQRQQVRPTVPNQGTRLNANTVRKTAADGHRYDVIKTKRGTTVVHHGAGGPLVVKYDKNNKVISKVKHDRTGVQAPHRIQ